KLGEVMTKEDWKIVRQKLDWPVFLCSGGLLVAFVLFSIIKLNLVSDLVSTGFDMSIRYFGAYWQFLVLATFIIGLILAITKYGKVTLGDADKPEMSYFKWAAVILTTGLGAGGVFWDAAETMFYFYDVLPMHSEIEDGSLVVDMPALSRSLL